MTLTKVCHNNNLLNYSKGNTSPSTKGNAIMLFLSIKHRQDAGLQCSPKVMQQCCIICKTLLAFKLNSLQAIKSIFLQKMYPECQTILIEDQAPCMWGLILIHIVCKGNSIWTIFRKVKYFFFIFPLEPLKGTM